MEICRRNVFVHFADMHLNVDYRYIHVLLFKCRLPVYTKNVHVLLFKCRLPVYTCIVI